MLNAQYTHKNILDVTSNWGFNGSDSHDLWGTDNVNVGKDAGNWVPS